MSNLKKHTTNKAYKSGVFEQLGTLAENGFGAIPWHILEMSYRHFDRSSTSTCEKSEACSTRHPQKIRHG